MRNCVQINCVMPQKLRYCWVRSFAGPDTASEFISKKRKGHAAASAGIVHSDAPGYAEVRILSARLK